MEIDLTCAADTAAAQSMIDKRVVPLTKKHYQSKNKQLVSFITANFHTENPTPPFALEHVKAFLGRLINSHSKPLAPSTLTGYSSAIRWLYREHNMDIPVEMETAISNILRGYKKDYAQKKLDGHVEVFEGKHHLPYEGYRLLAEKLLSMQPTIISGIKQHTWNEAIFAHTFFVLQWNLIARSSTIADMMYEHLSWQNDALIVSTPKHKGDQEGVKCYPKHVYSNTISPCICPILALSILTFTHSFRVNEHDANRKNFRLFAGTCQKQRFSSVLQSAIKRLSISEFPIMATTKDKLGTHSIRKGSASYASSMVGGASTAQIFLRAGWSLGNVQDRYLFGGEGQDQLCGRSVSGLPITDRAFATLPPHFSKDTTNSISEKEWCMMLPCYNMLPMSFKPAVPFLLASLVHHVNFLKNVLPITHPLFSAPVFASGYIDRLKDRVLLGIGTCTETGMIASGIPPHLAVANEMAEMSKQVQMSNTQIISECKKLPEQVARTILDNFKIDGTTPVTRADFDRFLTQVEMKILKANINCNNIAENTKEGTEPDQFVMNYWESDHKFHMVPQNWVLPQNCVKDVWLLWHFGHLQNKIRPYRLLEPMDMMNQNQRSLLSKIRRVMKEITKAGKDAELITEETQAIKMLREDSSSFFDKAFELLMNKLNRNILSPRWTEITIPTVYNLIEKYKKRRRDETQ